MLEETFKIEKGIERPVRAGQGKPRKYPFYKMEVGDSVFISGVNNQKVSGSFTILRPKRFSVRKWKEGEVTGIRVWRIE